MALTVEVLGSLAIRSNDGHSVRIPRKGRAMIGFLAVCQRRVGRERVADLLWPHQTTEQARHSLRNCLLEVRKIDRTVVEADFTDCWAGPGLTSDYDRFIELSKSPRLDRLCSAMQLYRGPLFESFELTGESWLEWMHPERDRLEQIAVDVLERLTSLAAAAGYHPLAIRSAKRLVGFDPLSEHAHCCLMRTLVAAGQRAEAVRAYNECVAVLRRELGVAPDIETQRLRQSIRDTGHPVEELSDFTPDFTPSEGVIRLVMPRIEPSSPAPTAGRPDRKSRLIKQLGILADAADAMAAAALQVRLAIGRIIETLDETPRETAHPEPLRPAQIQAQRPVLMAASSPR
jgi:DNA-binding SARP family transcriptional activator